MKIRLRLTLQFVVIIVVINIIAFISIYLFTSNHRSEEFYERLQINAVNTAKLLIDIQEIDLALLKIINQNTVSLPYERITIYNYLNEKIYSSSENSISYPATLFDEIRLKKEIRYRYEQFEVLGLLYEGEFDRFVILASALDQFGLSKLQNLKIVLLTVFIISTLITFIAGWLFAGQAMKPIKNIIMDVSNINDKSLNTRIFEGNGSDEIAKLAQTFNHMLNRLEDAFISQKSFVSNASHELRTPLTSITGQIEVALLTDRNKMEYQSILSSVLEDIKRLTQLTNGLLVLAQTNTDGMQSSFTLIRIDELLFQARESLLKKWPHCNIIIDFKSIPEDESYLMVKGEAQLLKSAFMNLMDNANKYSGGKKVHVYIDHIKNHIIISIRDSGPGISSDEMDKIFYPFYRGKNTQNIRGFGLGLSLAKKILEMHKSEIMIKNSTKGTAVKVTIPSA